MTVSSDYGTMILATASCKPAGMPTLFVALALALTVVFSYLVVTVASSIFGKYLSRFVQRARKWRRR